MFIYLFIFYGRRRRWPICWCCPDRGPGSFDVEDATTLSWSSAAVSEWVSLRPGMGSIKRISSDISELATEFEFKRISYYFYASTTNDAPVALCFCLIVASVRPVPNVFLSLRKNTEWISMNFPGGDHHHGQTNWLLNDNISGEMRFQAKWENIWIDFNQFGDDVKQVLTPSEWLHKFTAQTMADMITDILSS